MTAISGIFAPIFYPASVAIVGASIHPAKMGYYCVESLKKGRFKRVNPNFAKEFSS